MYVLTGIWTNQYDQIMRWCSSKFQSGISQVLDYVAYCYVILPRRPYYSILGRSYHTSLSAHLGVPCLRTRFSAYCTRSFSHLGISCLRPNILTYHPATPPPSGSYCVTLSPNILLFLASREIPAKFSWSYFYIASWHHQASLLCPPPSYPFYITHTSNSARNATHCATVSCRLLMKVIADCVLAVSRTTYDLGVSYGSSSNCRTRLPMIYLRNHVCVPYDFLFVAAERTHISEPYSSID